MNTREFLPALTLPPLFWGDILDSFFHQGLLEICCCFILGQFETTIHDFFSRFDCCNDCGLPASLKTRQLHIVVRNILIIPLLRDTWLPIKFCTHLRPATKSTPEKINCWIQPAINQPIPYPASLFFPFLCTSPSFIDNVHIINVHHVIT